MNNNCFAKMLATLAVLFMALTLSACNDNNRSGNSQLSVTEIPLGVQKVTIPDGSLTAWITIDSGSRTQMTLDHVAGTASATIPGLSRSAHTVLIEFEYTLNGNTMLIASAVSVVDLTSGSASLGINASDYITNYDFDNDGISNLNELAMGSNPFGLPAFSTSCFPVDVTNTYSDMAFDYNGDLLLPEYTSNTIRKMDHATCSITTMATISGQSVISVVEDKLLGRVFAGTSASNIYSINPNTGVSTLLVNLGAGYINSLVRAPEGYGSFGGQLIAATGTGVSGQILAIDQSVASPTPTLITDLGTAVPDIEFDADGILYAADFYGDRVITVAANGTVTDFVTGLDNPDGLEVDNAGSRLFIAANYAAGIPALYAADIPSGALTTLRKINFQTGGYGTTGLALDGNGTLLMHVASSQIVAQNVSLPRFNTSCLPLALNDTYGNVALRENGDLLIVDNHSGIYTDILRLDRDNCTTTTMATISGENVLSVVEDAALNRVYGGASGGNIYSIVPSTGASSLLTNVVGEVNAIVKAPAGYGSYGGQLIVASSDGIIYAVDQTASSPTPQSIVDIGQAASDLVFGNDGTLYVADYYLGKIITVAANGSMSDFATGFNRPDGLDIDQAGLQLFVADSTASTLSSVAIPGAGVTSFGSIGFGGGYYPSGLAFDGYGALLMHTSVGQLELFSIFDNYFGEYARLPNTSFFGANYLLGHSVEVTRRITLTDIGNWFVSGDSNAKFALYSDNAGRPGTLLASTASFATVANQNEIPTTSAVVVNPGTYWLMGVYDVIQSSYVDSSGNNDIHYILMTFTSAFPTTWPATDSQYLGNTLNYYLKGVFTP